MAGVRATRLDLRDFRNYERADVTLGDGLTVIVGPNGAGKTNLLEALYFGCTGRSCRTSNEREMVRFGEKLCRVEVTTEADDGGHRLEVGFVPGEPKRLRVDGAEVERLSSSSARPLLSVFLPDRLDLVKGPPGLRRAHLDQLVAALWPARAATRGAFLRALAQRNALLGRVRAGVSARRLLDPWDAELARHGVQLASDREEATAACAPAFAARAGELGLAEPAELRYRTGSSDPEALLTALREGRESDLARGFTGSGPHRDELLLLHGDRPLRAFGSQGQQRVALLALLFAERDVLLSGGRPPLMLLDDVMSELDPDRRARLAALVRDGGQALITSTDLDHVPGAGDPDVVVLEVEGSESGTAALVAETA